MPFLEWLRGAENFRAVEKRRMAGLVIGTGGAVALLLTAPWRSVAV